MRADLIDRAISRTVQVGAEPCGNRQQRVDHGCTKAFVARSPRRIDIKERS